MITAEQVREAIEENSWAETFMLREFNESSWQAIADELNATLGAGTCSMEYADDVPDSIKKVLGVYFCSECGSPTYNDVCPTYCMYCGAKVEMVES